MTLDTRAGGAEPLGDRRVAYYTQHTGPWMGLAARALFVQLGRYANPDTGKCWPTQDRLARDLDTSRQTIARLGERLVESGEVLIEQLQGESGKRNVYTFSGGLRKDWVPEDKPDLAGRSIQQYYFEENRRLKDQVADLQEAFNRLLATGELPDDLPGVTLPTAEANGASTSDTKEEEEELINSEDESSSSSVNAQENATLALAEAWVEENWPDIRQSDTRPNGWKDPGAAIATYVKNPDRFDRDTKSLEIRKAHKPDPPRNYSSGMEGLASRGPIARRIAEAKLRPCQGDADE